MATYSTDAPEYTVPDLRRSLLSQRETIDRQRAVIKSLTEALEEAKRTISIWHGPIGWNIYDRSSPEMKRLNGAVAQAREIENDAGRI